MAFSELGHLPPMFALWETLEGLGWTPKKLTLSFYRNHLVVCYFIFKSISFLITFNFLKIMYNISLLGGDIYTKALLCGGQGTTFITSSLLYLWVLGMGLRASGLAREPAADEPPGGCPSFSTVIILSILEVVIILLLIFLRKRILIAIALIKEASR